MLAGIIAGALGGGAQAAGQIADAAIQQRSRIDMAKVESELAMERQAAAERLRQTIAREDQTYNTVGQGGQEKLAFKKNETAQETEGLVAREGRLGPVRATNEGLSAEARGKAEGKVTKELGGDKDYVSAVRKLSLAKHVESSGSVAQAALANMEIAEKKKVLALIEEYDKPDTKPERRAAIKETLTVRGVLKPGEFDTERVTTETEDPTTGKKTKVESTQRRTGAAAAGAGGGEAKAHADARLAVSTGRISLEEANKRLVANGLKPLPAGDADTSPASTSSRPLYNAKQADLERMASRPKGVSVAEANAAQAELDARKRDPGRVSGF